MIEVRPGKEKIGIDHANSGLAMSNLNKLDYLPYNEIERRFLYGIMHCVVRICRY
jgi:hypothetical protein